MAEKIGTALEGLRQDILKLPEKDRLAVWEMFFEELQKEMDLEIIRELTKYVNQPKIKPIKEKK